MTAAGRACKSVAQQEEPATACRSRKSLQKRGAAGRACNSVAQQEEPAQACRSRKSLHERGAAGRACKSVVQQGEPAPAWRSRKSLHQRGAAGRACTSVAQHKTHGAMHIGEITDEQKLADGNAQEMGKQTEDRRTQRKRKT